MGNWYPFLSALFNCPLSVHLPVQLFGPPPPHFLTPLTDSPPAVQFITPPEEENYYCHVFC